MYQVNRINEYGQLYSSKGLLQFHNEADDVLTPKFADLGKARIYCKSYVRRYPFAACEIHDLTTQDIVEIIQDDEYWNLKNDNTQQWKVLNQKARKLSELMLMVLLVLVSVVIGLASHVLGLYGVSLLLKLTIISLLTVVIFKMFNWLLVRFL